MRSIEDSCSLPRWTWWGWWYSVATPFHPFGGAVDIIVVEQRDGSYRSTPWYVRFGKFQGVLKGAEKVVALLYKAAAPLHFTPSEAAPLGRPVLRLSAADPELCGTADDLLRHVDARFEGKPTVAPPPPQRPATRASLAAAAAEEVAEMVRLQHRSAERHLEGVAAKLAEMVKKGAKTKPGKGGGRTVPPLEGAEVRRLGKWYGDAMEVMLEHARMEERVLFPDIQRASFPGRVEVLVELAAHIGGGEGARAAGSGVGLRLRWAAVFFF